MFVITKIARQVEGEYVLLNVLGIFNKRENVDKFLSDKKMRYGETINGIDCVVEIGIIENVEVLDKELE